MVAECARVPGAPVVRMATSGGGFGGGGSIAFCTRRAAASCQCYYRFLFDAMPRAARTTAGSKGLTNVAGQSCSAGAGSSALHPPHDRSGPRALSRSA